LEEEDNLIAAHRWQIEETMAIVRQEMNLLGQVKQNLSSSMNTCHPLRLSSPVHKSIPCQV
jgi:hypothetical protein